MCDDGSLQPNSDPDVGYQQPVEKVEELYPFKPPLADTFEIGLALGGTVSAGTYSAGVLDFLIEALDAWTVAKNAGDPLAPRHKVKIRIVCGTSGGGVNAVLLSRALAYAFPHRALLEPGVAANPLHDTWVEDIDIRELLKTDDLSRSQEVQSLLCGNCIRDAAVKAGSYRGAPLGALGTPHVRDYVDETLPVVVTLTNLRGVQYSSHFLGAMNRHEFYTDRADHMRFRVDVSGKALPRPDDLKPYEIWVGEEPGADGKNPWDAITAAARGTAAFPVGLPPVVLDRKVEHYRYRYAVVETADRRPKAVWLRPEWRYLIAEGYAQDDPYRFLCVDGGCFNNEPISFAREYLAGVTGENERDGSKANRAVILVDPFADRAKIGPDREGDMLTTAGLTLGAMTSGARFQTADMSLFTDSEVFSRFLVNPMRKNPAGGTWAGGEALAASGLAAFMGFMCRDFREHDFQLGRRNCQAFLKAHFTLKPDNPLFDGWTEEQKKHFAEFTQKGELPIIPLLGPAEAEVQLPEWPRGKFDPESIRSAIAARLKKLAGKEAAPFLSGPWLLLLPIIKHLGGRAAKPVVAMIRQELAKKQLAALPPQPKV
jgi:predicted acylesterase/phospholipase RssA